MKKKTKKPSTTEQNVQYVTPEMYSAPPKIKENYSPSFNDYIYLNRSETKKSTTPRQKQKHQQNDYADYNYYFPESKRINTKTTAKASTSNDAFETFYQSQNSDPKLPISNEEFEKLYQQSDADIKSSIVNKKSYEKFYQPQSADAVVRKEVSNNGDELTYHYYYPTEDATPQSPSSTFTPQAYQFPSSTTTKLPSYPKSSTKKKISQVHTSTDAYQYPPVLQRPNDFDLNTNEASQEPFYPTFEQQTIYRTPSSTSTPVKMLKPTRKNNHYLPSSTMSPSTTARPMKIRRPSSEIPKFEKFSLPPSISTTTMAPHYSTTSRAPELYKYSTMSPVSSTTLNEFYIKPSTQVTPTVTSDLFSDSSSDRTIIIKPKVQYTSTQEDYEQQPTSDKETIVYKYVNPQEYYGHESNKTNNEVFYSPALTSDYEAAKTPEYYKELNHSTQADMDFYKKFHKNYNYEYFTEQDAGKMMNSGEDKIDVVDDKQRASKKNMVFAISPEPRYASSSMHPLDLDEHEVPPPMNDHDSDNDGDLMPEASKNQQYYVLYSVDDENRRDKKPKKKVKPEQDVVYHHHHHQHEGNEKEYDYDFPQFDTEIDSEFDSELVNSDNVRIVDPGVRGGRPIEFTKDDYLRHIKQAVVQYMKNVNVNKDSTPSSTIGKPKSQRYQENNQDSHLRPTKASIPSSIVSSTSSYKQYKPMAPLKLPKNVYTADRLKEAIDEIQESPQIDLTLKKSKVKPFDLSAIDVGQTYQHVTQFDHSAALKNVEEFDQSNAMTSNNKQKLHFSQQTYHDINNLGNSHKHKLNDDSENENEYKGYMLSNKYQNKLVHNNQNQQQYQNAFSSMNYDSSKLPRIISQNDDDEDENKVDDTIDAPIQIINGIPVANPYNIDLNTLK